MSASSSRDRRCCVRAIPMQTFPMTSLGFKKLVDELHRLKTRERPAVIQALADARTQGEMTENAEYFVARERQSFVEGRIAELEEIIAAANVVDPATACADHIAFGAHVWLVDEDTENEVRFQIVGMHEADVKLGRLSICSPLGQALIGKKVGDSVSVPAPGGERTYRIRDLRFG